MNTHGPGIKKKGVADSVRGGNEGEQKKEEVVANKSSVRTGSMVTIRNLNHHGWQMAEVLFVFLCFCFVGSLTFVRREWYGGVNGGAECASPSPEPSFVDYVPMDVCLSIDLGDDSDPTLLAPRAFLLSVLLHDNSSRAITITECNSTAVTYIEYNSLECSNTSIINERWLSPYSCIDDTIRLSSLAAIYTNASLVPHFNLSCAWEGEDVPAGDSRVSGLPDRYWKSSLADPILSNRRDNNHNIPEEGDDSDDVALLAARRTQRRAMGEIGEEVTWSDPAGCGALGDEVGVDDGVFSSSNLNRLRVKRGCLNNDYYAVRLYSSVSFGGCDESQFLAVRTFLNDASSAWECVTDDMSFSTQLALSEGMFPSATTQRRASRHFFPISWDPDCDGTAFFTEFVPLRHCYAPSACLNCPSSQQFLPFGSATTAGEPTALLLYQFDTSDCSGDPVFIGTPHLGAQGDSSTCVQGNFGFSYVWNLTRDAADPKFYEIQIAQFPDCSVANAEIAAKAGNAHEIFSETSFISLPTDFCWPIEKPYNVVYSTFDSVRGHCHKGVLNAENFDGDPFCQGGASTTFDRHSECIPNRWDYDDEVGEVFGCYLVSCNNILSNREDVCNGNGICTDTDTCDCFRAEVSGRPLWGGQYCATWIGPTNKTLEIVLTILGILAGLVLFALLIAGIVGGVFLYRRIAGQRAKLSKFQLVDDVELVLEEQRLQKEQSLKHLRVNRKIFRIKGENVKLLAVLGEGGGSAVVFKAEWQGRLVAFKSFKIQAVDAMEEFEKEVSIMASISHPSVLDFYGACLAPPRIGYLMELCEFGDMKAFFRKYSGKNGHEYPLQQKIRILQETASAINYLHSVEIIHRDIKPENVLINGAHHAKLMDFGVSRYLSKTTQMTRRIGTRDYLAPEKCDVFSFGILAYVALTEEWIPYGEKSFLIEQFIATDSEFRPNIRKLPEGVEEWLVALVQSCWSMDPDDRPSFPEILGIFSEKSVVEVKSGSLVSPIVQAEEEGKKNPVEDEEALLRRQVQETDEEIRSLNLQVTELREFVASDQKVVEELGMGMATADFEAEDVVVDVEGEDAESAAAVVGVVEVGQEVEKEDNVVGEVDAAAADIPTEPPIAEVGHSSSSDD